MEGPQGFGQERIQYPCPPEQLRKALPKPKPTLAEEGLPHEDIQHCHMGASPLEVTLGN